MRKIDLLLTAILLLFITAGTQAQSNVFNPSDPIVYYDPGNAPFTNWGNIQKWVVTNRNLGWNTSSYKAYHFNGVSFRLKFPKSYQHNVADGKKYPVMVFWHGAGVKGSIYDNELQLLEGAEVFRDRVDNGEFDGFLIFPQNTGGSFGSSYYIPMIQVLDSLAKHCKLDVDRVLVNGASAGGSASFEITAAFPHRITKSTPSSAAATGLIPIIDQFVHVPIWFATGGLDANPSLFMARSLHDSLKAHGADVKWTLYPDRGHFIYYSHWFEPGYVEYMNDMHKANPLVYFQRNEFCPDEAINARMGISPGFAQYEWAVNTGSGYSTIPGATSNEYTATAYGTYRVRFRRVAGGPWSEWSPKPVVVAQKSTTVTPPIAIKGQRSKVLPAPDGSTTVPLRLPPGFVAYEYWKLAADSTIVGTDSTYEAVPGMYRARVKEQFGCNAFFSPDFTVVPADGVNKPDAAKNLTALALTPTSIQLDWSDNPGPAFDETGFEIYRATTSGGPYTYAGMAAANVLTFVDQNLASGKTYYYIVRAVNNTSAAAANSNQASATTTADNVPPTAPGNLRAIDAGRHSVTLEWDASTDNGAVAKYDIYVNGTRLYTSDKTWFVINELDSFQRYNFVVKAKDEAGNVSPASNQLNIVTKLQGLSYKYYEGSWFTLPDFDALGDPLERGITSDLDLGIRNREDAFGIIWRGYINIPTTGTYTFETCSDDATKLYIDMPYSHTANANVVNDYPHPMLCKTGTPVFLTAGLHSIVVTYMEVGSDQAIELYWQNDAGLARQRVPASAFSDSFTAPGTPPAAPAGLAANATGYDRIALSWTDNSGDETGFEVVRATAAAGPFQNIGTTAAGVTSFIDSGRNASTTYWYKVRAVGDAGGSAFTAVASATTQAAPPAPAAPSLLNATVVSSSAINLAWNDNSSNETVFEIYRSTDNNTSFRLIATVAGGAGAQKNYADAGLFAHVTYFYKVRAKGVGGTSAYTNEASGTTLNTIPVVKDVIDFTIRHSVTYELPLSAADPDGDALTFSSDNLPWFATLTNGTNGTAQLKFDPGFSDQGGYMINIYVSDGNGGADTTYLNVLVNENYPPTLNTINNVVIDEGGTLDLNLVAGDNENPSFIGWSFTGLPSFGNFNHNNAGTGTLHLAPGYASSGVYNVSLMVDDGFGAWVMRNFTITVNEKDPNEKILVSIKNGTAAPAPWNDMGSRTISNLKNTNGVTTTVGAAVQNSWQFNLNNLGAQTGNNSGVYPDAVMKDAVHWGYFLGSNAVDTSVLTISGLNPARKYTLAFFGSSVFNLYPDNGTTTYKIGSTAVSLGVQNNTKNKVAINDVSPNASGIITVQMIGDPHPDLGGWLNAFEIINQYDDGTRPARPIDLTGEFVEHKGSVLNWTDVAYNETKYRVFRATSITGPYTQINNDANTANLVTYSDATAVPLTQYYYFVKAFNASGESDPSDTVSVLTGNNSPTIQGLDNIFVKTESSFNEDFSVSDNAGDVVSVTAENLPPFVTLQPMGGTNYRLVADPGKEYLGIHSVTIVAKDNKGGSSAKTISVQVADKRTRSFYVNFGMDGSSGGAPWNDFVGFAYVGKQLLNLKDEAGNTTGISIRIEDNWSNTFNQGYVTGNNSGVYKDSVLKSGIFSDQPTARRISFIGLDPAKKYNVAFIGSSNNGITAGADYSATGITAASLNARYNQHQLAYLNELTPGGANNSIMVSVTKHAGSPFTYLNGIVLEEYTDTVVVMNPIHLHAEIKGKTSVALVWADRANNETGYDVEIATSASGPWTATTVAANTTMHTFTGLTPNTQYWFRVRARAAGPVFSEYSNTRSAITPKSAVYVNLTFTYPAGAPWNNTNVNPDAGKSFPDLKNDEGQITNMTMTITKGFNGQNDAGMQSGGAGVFPDAVMRSCYWLDRTQLGQFKLSGLNHSKRYRIGFFGSIGPGWDGDFTATYTIGNRTVYLNSYRNDSEVAYIGDVVPDENGEVLLNVSSPATSNYGFTTAIVIQTYDDPAGGTVLSTPDLGEDGEGRIVESARNSQGQAVIDERSQQVRIQAYPNPFMDNIRIDFNNNSASNQVAVDIVDVTGRLVFRRDAGRLPAGMNTLRLDVGSATMTPGVYFIRVKVNGKLVNTTKLLKARK
ncbi:MAG TPA: fibronectin type III domain-containing protein [Chitinophagaceae bacterium]|nr:fibronectin type III domain-containing protein [Chitinophagaceae bacterium]